MRLSCALAPVILTLVEVCLVEVVGSRNVHIIETCDLIGSVGVSLHVEYSVAIVAIAGPCKTWLDRPGCHSRCDGRGSAAAA